MNEQRLKRVLHEMEKQNLTQMIISDPSSIFYLTGNWIHPGERMLALYINQNGNNKLFINELFPIKEDLGVDIIWFNDCDDAVSILVEHINREKPIGIDKNWPARFLLKLMEYKGGSAFLNGSMILDRIRMNKDENERNLMRKASKLNDIAIERLIELIPRLHSEKKMGQLLLEIYEDIGADGYSFDPIIAFGENAANPHHSCSNCTVSEGQSIILDIGCAKDSYCSDMTRTVFYKYASDSAKKIYNTVLEANKRAIDIIKPGIRFCDVDAAARNYIDSEGYGKFFTHRTGHSIGIEVHDFGDVSAINTDILEPGMIFSVEPGIYLPGEVGVRIEDLVLVTDNGYEVLNNYNKELQIVE